MHKQSVKHAIDFYILMLLYELHHIQGYMSMSIFNELYLIKNNKYVITPNGITAEKHENYPIARNIIEIE